MRRLRYRDIAEDLRRRVEAGEFRGVPAGTSGSGGVVSAGGLLPSEADLSAAYGASRVTIRKALDELRDAGLVDSRQGFGWFVAVDPLRQSLARLGTIEGQLAASGMLPERRVLDFAFGRAPPWVRRLLGTDRALEVRRLNLADGQPFARVTVWCPEGLGSELSRADVERSPFYELLPVELGGATQTIGAAAASEGDAALLGVPPGSPVLRCQRVTTALDGSPVLVSEHVFPAHRTEFVVDLPHTERSMAATGLRLVE